MSLVKSVAGTTLRLQQQNAKAQQKCTKAGASSQSSSNNNSNNNPTANHTMATTTSQASTGNCLQPSSPPSSSSKTSLSTSPITANFMGSSTCSSSLFSFESGVVLSGSSGCCSLSNSPPSSSSSSSNSYLTSQTIEATTSGNQVCANTSTAASHLDESFSSNTCPLNASLLAAVNGDLDDDHVMPKTLSLADSPNQNETNIHVSESMESNSNEIVSNGDNGQMLLLENLHQQSATDNSCLNNEDARTLQLAVELTMMNLNQLPSSTSGAQTISTPVTSATNFQLHSHHLHNGSSIDHHQQLHQPFSSSSSYNSSVNNPYHMTTKVFLQTQSQAAATSLLNQKFLSDSSQDHNIPSKVSALTSNSNQNLIAAATTDERSKKSQNMTECVPVPSSEHVAEIVGRQGCKIKALRAKTNTYIKTPVRNEEPVFVVTGRKEDVAKAKREILSAAEHFTLIRATRRTNDGINGCSANITSGGGGGHLISLNKNSLSSTTPLPGQVTIQVRVPYRVVGLVVGPKGNTIKHIQHETQTYIVTPSRDKEPIFEVTGMPDNVQMARKQIEAHIATRTGNSLNSALAIPAPPPPPPPPPAPAGTINRLNETLNSAQNTSSASTFHSINTLNQILNDDLHSEILSSIYKNGIGSALEYSQIGGNVINASNKCNTSNSFNGFMNSEINPGTLSLNEIQRRVAHNSGNNNASNFDFINSLMDSNTTQFVNEQNTNFPQLSNSATAIRNLKSVISTINILENSSNGAGSLLQQPNSLSTNALLTRSCSSASSTASSSKSFSNNGNSNNNPFWKSFNGGSSVSAGNGSCNGVGNVNNDCIDVDEGIGESPLYSWGLPNTLAALTNSYCSPASTSISPTDSLFGEHVHTKAATAILQQQHQIKSSSKTKLLEKVKRSNCWMCQEKDIFAALLPCGHKMFCYDCANRLCQQNEAICPVCSTQIYQAVRIQN